MFHLLLLTGLLFEASMSQITSYGNRTADFGKDAYYRCEMNSQKGVQQVLWQKLVKGGTPETIATFSEAFGEKINEPYREKISFMEASLSSSSINVSSVAWEDEGCYICSFNIYPLGSQSRKICLTVKGLSEATSEVLSTSKPEDDEGHAEVVISCSATGKPTPTIRWDFPGDVRPLEKHRTVTANADQTFTSSGNITLQMPSGWTGNVDCVLNEGLMGQRIETKHFNFAGEKKEEKVRELPSTAVAVTVSSIILLMVVIVAVVLWQKGVRCHKGRDSFL